VILAQLVDHFSRDDMQTGTYKLPPVKRQALIRKGLGRWLTVIDFLLQRFAGIERIIERHEEDDPMVVMVTIINEVSTMTDAQAIEAHLRRSLAYLPLFHYRAMHPGEPWDSIEGSLEEFKARGRHPFGKIRNPNPEPGIVERWLDSAVRSGAQL
jgi:hypothetical protein